MAVPISKPTSRSIGRLAVAFDELAGRGARRVSLGSPLPRLAVGALA